MELRYEGSDLLELIAEAENEKQGLVSLGWIRNYCGDWLYVVDVKNDKSSYREFRFSPGEPGELEARKAYVDAVSYYNSLVPQDKAYAVEWEEYYDGSAFDKALGIIYETYENMSRLPKPKPYKVGGTYYGGTQLFSSRGCHLDLLENDNYQSYDSYCGTRTDYIHLWGLRIGGAYDTDCSSKLTKFLKDNREQLIKEGFSVIDDCGTNFSVYGVAVRK